MKDERTGRLPGTSLMSLVAARLTGCAGEGAARVYPSLRPIFCHITRELTMTPAEEQQMLASLSDISQDIKALLTLIKDLTRQQNEADQKAYGQLVNIAHKR